LEVAEENFYLNSFFTQSSTASNTMTWRWILLL